MCHTAFSARQVYGSAPLGSIIRFYDATPEPPARYGRKRTECQSPRNFDPHKRVSFPLLRPAAGSVASSGGAEQRGRAWLPVGGQRVVPIRTLGQFRQAAA
jgi:hypothetical protein